jgi:hypothetical protein
MKTEEELIFEQYSLLLEKDHRKKMIKFGIPEDVADYLHNFSSKYSIWFANQIKDLGNYKNSQDKVNWIRVNEGQFTGILDWVRNTPNINLKDYNLQQAVQAAAEYHNNLKATSLEGEEKNTIIKKYGDGFYWVDLETSDCREEGGAMGHCARTSAETMFSLRKYTPETQTIDPVVTVAANPDDGSWQQAKGKKNSKPKEEYWKYIADILVEYNMLVYKPEYDSSNDFRNDDLYRYVEENQEEFENAEEILENIEESLITFEDFENAYKEGGGEDCKYYSMYIDDDADEYISHRRSINITFDLDYFGEYAGNVETFLNNIGEDSEEGQAIIEKISSEYVTYSGTYQRGDFSKIDLYGDLEGDDLSTLTEESLDSFKRLVSQMLSDDAYLVSQVESYNGKYFEEQLKEYLQENDILPDPEFDYDDPIKKVARKDPRQMELDLNKTKIKFKKIFYS